MSSGHRCVPTHLYLSNNGIHLLLRGDYIVVQTLLNSLKSKYSIVNWIYLRLRVLTEASKVEFTVTAGCHAQYISSQLSGSATGTLAVSTLVKKKKKNAKTELSSWRSWVNKESCPQPYCSVSLSFESNKWCGV